MREALSRRKAGGGFVLWSPFATRGVRDQKEQRVQTH